MRHTAPRFRQLPPLARVLVPAALVLSAAGVVTASRLTPGPSLDPLLAVAAATLCTGANLFEVMAPGNYSFQPNLVFFFWAAVLLPAWALAPLAVLCFLPGALARRSRWYMPAFNAANYALAGLVAHVIVSAAPVRDE
ncbi:MAG TPA: hypothetical protein VGJ32_15285, partial [Solirubrobacteraceae bacterium]